MEANCVRVCVKSPGQYYITGLQFLYQFHTRTDINVHTLLRTRPSSIIDYLLHFAMFADNKSTRYGRITIVIVPIDRDYAFVELGL
jgi:hypothetical protein